MTRNPSSLPQLQGDLFLTDGGLETTLIFHEGIDLPDFAAFTLLADDGGTTQLRKYFQRYAELARRHEVGLVLETPTWRASSDWGERLGYDADALADANRQAIALMHELREEYESDSTPVVVSGNIGPRGDGYRPDVTMSADEAAHYHTPQIRTFADAGADMVAAFTLTTVEEAIGITEAAQANDIPVVISFTVETDGRLPNGESLSEAIERTDHETGEGPAYYMINCAHPSHFADVLRQQGDWVQRIGGLRVNASKRSHAELDNSDDLDEGDPDELAREHVGLQEILPGLRVVGGCCGTDHRHVDAIFRGL